eukprot:3278262-Rhodomonas_salina.2
MEGDPHLGATTSRHNSLSVWVPINPVIVTLVATGIRASAVNETVSMFNPIVVPTSPFLRVVCPIVARVKKYDCRNEAESFG